MIDILQPSQVIFLLSDHLASNKQEILNIFSVNVHVFKSMPMLHHQNRLALTLLQITLVLAIMSGKTLITSKQDIMQVRGGLLLRQLMPFESSNKRHFSNLLLCVHC